MGKRKIAKTLLVGLGGTGNLALKFAKKRFYEMYGNDKPFSEFELPLIEYLALDTSIDDLKQGVGTNNKFGLKQSEYHHLKVSKPRQVLKGAPFIEKEWMPKKNVRALSAIEAGAGQIRAFGRLGLMNNYQKVEKIVQSKVNNLNSWEQDQNPDYEAMGGAVNIVFCFSVAGGTGSGTFLDMAYLIKNCLNNTAVEFRSQAYVILPEIFDKVIKSPLSKKRIWSNSYGALRELEFFMEDKYKADIELLDNNRMTIPVDGAPFNLVHLISDKNSKGTDYDEIPHIMELVGNSIVFKSGELNTKSKSEWDNVGKDVSMINYLDDAKTQKPRYLGLGYAEIQYDTKIVSDFFVANYSSYLSDFIIATEDNRESEMSLEQRVLAWGIKEDEADDVIDQLLPSNSFTTFVVDGDGYDGANTRSQLEANAEAHLSHQIQNMKQKSAANLQELQSRVIKNITDDFIHNEGCILNKGGITTAIDAIDMLLAEPFIKRYALQMNDEIENDFSGTGKGVKHNLKTIATRIQEELKALGKAQDSNWLNRRRNCMPIIESLVSSYNKLLNYNSQKIKREDAKRFYAKLTTELEKLKNKLSDFKSKMAECKSDFHNAGVLIRKTLEKDSLKPFTIEVHKTKITHSDTSVESSIELSLFLDNKKINLSSFIDKKIDDIKDEVRGFIQGTSVIEDIKKVNLTTYLSENEEKAVEHLKDVKKMSHPLLQVITDKFSLQMGDDWTETVLWGVGSNQPVYKLIDSHIESDSSDRMFTHDDSFLMLSTLNYPAPIFALTNMQRYYDDYMNKRAHVSCDIDKRIREAMDKENFELIPKDVAREKTIFAWVFGLILYELTDGEDGIHRKGSGRFFLKTKEASRADKHWLDLNTPWRTLAFEEFRDKNFEGEMLQKINKHLNNIGGDKLHELIQEIKDDYSSIYISKYSKLNRSWEDLKSSKDSRDKEVAELMELEIEFIVTLSVESVHDYL
jgi:hypothetical protein